MQLPSEVHNYAFMLQVKPRPDIAAWAEENLKDANKLTVNLDEIKHGAHLTLLFVGDNGLHGLYQNNELVKKLEEEINKLPIKLALQAPLEIAKVNKFGFAKQTLVLELKQDSGLLNSLNAYLKIILRNYRITANQKFPFSAHLSIASTQDNGEIPDELVEKLSQGLASLENKRVHLNPYKFELSRRDGTGPAAPTTIVKEFKGSPPISDQLTLGFISSRPVDKTLEVESPSLVNKR